MCIVVRNCIELCGEHEEVFNVRRKLDLTPGSEHSGPSSCDLYIQIIKQTVTSNSDAGERFSK